MLMTDRQQTPMSVISHASKGLKMNRSLKQFCHIMPASNSGIHTIHILREQFPTQKNVDLTRHPVTGANWSFPSCKYTRVTKVEDELKKQLKQAMLFLISFWFPSKHVAFHFSNMDRILEILSDFERFSPTALLQTQFLPQIAISCPEHH